MPKEDLRETVYQIISPTRGMEMGYRLYKETLPSASQVLRELFLPSGLLVDIMRMNMERIKDSPYRAN